MVDDNRIEVDLSGPLKVCIRCEVNTFWCGNGGKKLFENLRNVGYSLPVRNQ